jgi:hypothetical protein
MHGDASHDCLSPSSVFRESLTTQKAVLLGFAPSRVAMIFLLLIRGTFGEPIAIHCCAYTDLAKEIFDKSPLQQERARADKIIRRIAECGGYGGGGGGYGGRRY